MRPILIVLALFACASALPAATAATQEPDHEIHEELRAMLRDVQAAMNDGAFDRMLPLLHERIAATSVTQEAMGSRDDVSAFFKAWFGPAGYMKRMKMTMTADELTELSADRSWGLVRGSALEHYEAKDGNLFDFKTRWTAVVTRSDDGRWRLRAIHFGTNHLDNPVLTRVRDTLTRYAWYAAGAGLLAGLAVGFLAGRRRAGRLATPA